MQEIPLFQPDVGEAEERAVLSVLRSGKIGCGRGVEVFEELVSGVVGRGHGVAVNSAGSALWVTLLALGVGPGDEVVTSPFACVSSAHAIIAAGARPVFAEIDPRTLLLEAGAVDRAVGPRTKAIVASATLGNVEGLEGIAAVASRREVVLIEDARGALGSRHGSVRAGSVGRAAVFGFSEQMVATCGEGGMIVTDDARLAEACRCVRNQGRPSGTGAGWGAGWGGASSARGREEEAAARSWCRHERVGASLRMSGVCAALGGAQVGRLVEMIQRRGVVARRYIERLAGMRDVVLPNVSDASKPNWGAFVVRLVPAYTQEERDRVAAGLRRHEIGVGTDYPAVHLLPGVRAALGDAAPGAGSFPIAESVGGRCLGLPMSSVMGESAADDVCSALEVLLSRENLGRR
jgi:perosamine synthetase